MSSWSPTKYKTKNWRSYNSALKQRGSLSIWFDPDMPWYATPTGKRGWQPEFSDAAIQICLTMKVLFGMPLRQTAGFVESLLLLAGLDWKVPDFSTLCRRQKALNVAIPYRGGTGPFAPFDRRNVSGALGRPLRGFPLRLLLRVVCVHLVALLRKHLGLPRRERPVLSLQFSSSGHKH